MTSFAPPPLRDQDRLSDASSEGSDRENDSDDDAEEGDDAGEGDDARVQRLLDPKTNPEFRQRLLDTKVPTVAQFHAREDTTTRSITLSEPMIRPAVESYRSVGQTKFFFGLGKRSPRTCS